MMIKTTVAQERSEIETLGDVMLRWYDTRISAIQEDSSLNKEEQRKKKRSIYIRTKAKFVRDTQLTTASVGKKPRAKKNARKDYLTYSEFEEAVFSTVPVRTDEKDMFEESFYVYSLTAFFEDSVLPPEYFMEHYIKRFGQPTKSILLKQGDVHLLALGVVEIQV